MRNIGRKTAWPFWLSGFLILIFLSFFILFLAVFQTRVIHIRVFRICTSRIRLVLTRLARVRGMGRLIDDILHIHDLALAVPKPVADYVPGPFQLFQGGADAVRALLADFCQAPGSVVPVLRQRQHHGEQPFGFQGQLCVAQVVVGHHRVVAGFLNAKYRHGITSFRRSEKVLVFGEKTASIPLGHPGGENLWAVAVKPIAEEGT